MIITRSPLRITLGGGGTDLPSYYRERTGFLVAAAINKYVYITINKRFVAKILLKYMKNEEVETISQIEHPIFKEVLKHYADDTDALEINSIADVPGGTGLGSSGSFTVSLIKAIQANEKKSVSVDELAKMACKIEIDILKEPIGKQDQYISAYGGVNCFTFNSDDTVEVSKLNIDKDNLYNLEDNLLLFFTGYSRSSSTILKEQDKKTRSMDMNMISNLDYVKALGLESKNALESGDLRRFGEIMHEHWLHKKSRSSKISSSYINEIYEFGLKNGAIGGKLVGAGGGGFLMFYTEQQGSVRKAMREARLEEMRFNFDYVGTEVLAHS
jgi:D-glycero-alpha-D-manno-heptose-7-phosphate kinase